MFTINNLTCCYSNGPKVLEVDDISFEKGKLYFLLGASGSGKSTFLETLGLMNKPVSDDTPLDSIVFNNDINENTNIIDLWSKSDLEISQFRRKNYSFIFQSTNLMPHFSAGENMVYTLLLEGMPFDEAKSKVITIMSDLFLDESVFDKSIQNLSGGQRQRLAFVRAFISPFQVLFGDEPTGNLDPVTGYKLMEILKSYLSKNNKTGIIVSHDIPLALHFADYIYYIDKITQGPDEFGILNQNNKIQKDTSGNWWHGSNNLAGQEIDFLKEYLK